MSGATSGVESLLNPMTLIEIKAVAQTAGTSLIWLIRPFLNNRCACKPAHWLP